jgi:transcriptional regulator with XRE-family HTH domain
MKKKEKFGGTLKRLRSEAGLSQKELADKVGLTREHIARLETNDDVKPLWETVQNLAAALGVDCTAFQDAPATGRRIRKK